MIIDGIWTNEKYIDTIKLDPPEENLYLSNWAVIDEIFGLVDFPTLMAEVIDK